MKKIALAALMVLCGASFSFGLVSLCPAVDKKCYAEKSQYCIEENGCEQKKDKREQEQCMRDCNDLACHKCPPPCS